MMYVTVDNQPFSFVLGLKLCRFIDCAETRYTIPSQQYLDIYFVLYSAISSNIEKPTANQASALLAS